MKLRRIEIQKQAEAGGSVDLVYYLTRAYCYGLVVLLAIGALSACGLSESAMGTAEDAIAASAGPDSETTVLSVGDSWKHVAEDAAVTVRSVDLKAAMVGIGIRINGSQELRVTIEETHFNEAVVSNDYYARTLDVEHH